MTLRFIDSFDHYVTITDKWTAASGGAIEAGGRNGTQCVRLGDCGGGAPCWIRLTVPGGAKSELIFGAAFKAAAIAGTSGRIFMGFKDSTGGFDNVQFGVAMNPANGHLQAVLGNDTFGGLSRQFDPHIVVAEGTTVLIAGAYFYLEIRVLFGAAGSYTLKINEVVELTAAGVNTKFTAQSSADVVYLQSNGSDPGFRFDDLYVIDTLGAVNNTYLGDVRVEALYPSADGFHGEWTPNAGVVHFNRVNEHPADEDSTYEFAAVAGLRDSFAFTDLSVGSAAIKGIQYLHRPRVESPGARSVNAFYRTGAIDFDDATALSLTTSYIYPIGDIVELNPATGLAWTFAEINAAEWGFRLTT